MQIGSASTIPPLQATMDVYPHTRSSQRCTHPPYLRFIILSLCSSSVGFHPW